MDGLSGGRRKTVETQRGLKKAEGTENPTIGEEGTIGEF